MERPELIDADSGITLGESRARVLELLRAADEPMGVADVAARTGLHTNTARFHLDGLTEAGLASRTAEERRQPGRPRAVYRASATGPDPGVRSYRLLAQMLTSMVTGMMPDPPAAAAEAGRAWGRHLTDRPAPFQQVDADEALDRLNGLLASIGFVSELAPESDETKIKLHHCPFREIAETDRQVVCPMHLGIMQGALDEMRAPVTADRLDPFVEPRLCVAHLTRPTPENPEGS